MTSVWLEPVKGGKYRLSMVFIGTAISLFLILSKLVDTLLAIVPIGIGLGIWAVLFHFAWKGFDPKTGQWHGEQEWRNKVEAA